MLDSWEAIVLLNILQNDVLTELFANSPERKSAEIKDFQLKCVKLRPTRSSKLSSPLGSKHID